MSDINKVVGERIRDLRDSKGFSQEKLANKCHVDRSYISRIERGMISPTVSKLKVICTVLDHDLTTFFKELEL